MKGDPSHLNLDVKINKIIYNSETYLYNLAKFYLINNDKNILKEKVEYYFFIYFIFNCYLYYEYSFLVIKFKTLFDFSGKLLLLVRRVKS